MFSTRVRLISNTLGSRKSARQVVAGATSRFLRRQGEVYLRYMQQEAPIGQTGLLARSHILRLINQYRAEIANTASYAAPVFYGSDPHMPPESSGLPYPVRLSIARHGTRPNPWMARGAMMGSREIGQNAEQMLSEIAREIL